MRILHLSSLYPPRSVGGAEKVVARLAEAQARSGSEVGVAFLTPISEAPGEQAGVATLPLAARNPLWIETSGRHHPLVRLLNKVCTVLNVVTAAQFGAAIDRFRPDVIHTHSLVELPPLVWREARRRGIPLVHTLHDYDLLCIRAALFKDGEACLHRHIGCAVISRWKAAFAGCIDAVAAVSGPVLDRHLGFGIFADLPNERRFIVWNPVELPASPMPLRKPSAGRPLTFGYLGRLVSEKGIDLLLQACRSLPGQGWRLQVAGRAASGDGGYAARSDGLPVDFLGYVDASAFLAGIDVLVVPSIWSEPFGLTVIEALAAGVPVIGCDVGAIGELIRQSAGPGWLVPPTADALAAKMAAVMRGEVAWPEQARIEQLLGEVSPARTCERYLNVYDAAIAARGRGRVDASALAQGLSV